MNVLTFHPKLFSNISTRFLTISHDKWKVWPAGGIRGKGRSSPEPVGFMVWRPRVSVQLFIEIHQRVAEIFQSGKSGGRPTACYMDSNCRPWSQNTVKCFVPQSLVQRQPLAYENRTIEFGLANYSGGRCECVNNTTINQSTLQNAFTCYNSIIHALSFPFNRCLNNVCAVSFH